jgi:hypothetical protein
MPIRLLKKSELATAQSLDRSREIAEGLKISRKVDNLRELQANEEQTLEKFRVETLTAIQAEISGFVASKEALVSEVRELQKKLDGMLPSMAVKRNDLNALKIELEKREKEIGEKTENLNLLEIDIAIALKNAEDSLKRRNTHEEIAKNLHKTAVDKEEEAKGVLTNARITEERALQLQKDVEQSLSLREQGVSEKENMVKAQLEDNLNISRELEQEKIRLADQRGTLERALERIRQNRL